MNRRTADLIVGALAGSVLLLGGLISWQTYQRNRALNRMMESMMGPSGGPVHGTNPLWYVLGTIVLVAVIVGLYLVVRAELTTDSVTTEPTIGGTDPVPTTDADGDGKRELTGDDIASPSGEPSDTASRPRRRVLDLLPEDERRVLEPVVTSPGLTQIELRDRSDFSKSKVSQTVSALEKRGLLYRERQGRTYRVYPGDELDANGERRNERVSESR